MHSTSPFSSISECVHGISDCSQTQMGLNRTYVHIPLIANSRGFTATLGNAPGFPLSWEISPGRGQVPREFAPIVIRPNVFGLYIEKKKCKMRVDETDYSSTLSTLQSEHLPSDAGHRRRLLPLVVITKCARQLSAPHLQLLLSLVLSTCQGAFALVRQLGVRCCDLVRDSGMHRSTHR